MTDANGLSLAYVYVRDERAGSMDGLTEDEARRIAASTSNLIRSLQCVTDAGLIAPDLAVNFAA